MIAIFGNDILSADRILLGDFSILSSCFISIVDKTTAELHGIQIATDPGTDDFKSSVDPDVYITADLLGMAAEGEDSQLAFISTVFPPKLGEKSPFQTGSLRTLTSRQ